MGVVVKVGRLKNKIRLERIIRDGGVESMRLIIVNPLILLTLNLNYVPLSLLQRRISYGALELDLT